MYELLHPGQEAQDYPEVILSSLAAQKHPATLLQRLCCPNTSLLGGDTMPSDAGEQGDAQQSMGSGGSRGSSQEGGPLLSQWGEAGTPGLRLPLPGNLPTAGVLALLSSQRRGFLSRLAL